MNATAAALRPSTCAPPRTLPTWHQAFILAFILGIRKQRGCSPSTRDIANALGVNSANAVNDHLLALKRKGFVTWQKGKSSTLVPLAYPNCDSCGGTGSRTAKEAGLVLTEGSIHRRRATHRLCSCCAGTGYQISNPDKGLHYAHALLSRVGVPGIRVSVEVSS